MDLYSRPWTLYQDPDAPTTRKRAPPLPWDAGRKKRKKCH